jgi:hypothetical protein
MYGSSWLSVCVSCGGFPSISSSIGAGAAATAGSKWYDVTHNGLDAVLQRFVSDMEILLSLPMSKQNVHHPW